MSATTRSDPLPRFPAIRLAEQHRREQLDERGLFLQTFADLWRMLTFADLRDSLVPWLERTADAVAEHHQRSARTAARYYSSARALPRTPPSRNPAGIVLPRRLQASPRPTTPRPAQARPAAAPSSDRRRGTRPAPSFVPTPAPRPDRRDVRHALSGAALGTVTQGRERGLVDLDALNREAFAETSRVASDLVLAGGQDTIDSAVRYDPDALGYARITDGDPCAWCALLASRGFVYKTAATATAGSHRFCACTSMARFRGDNTPLPEDNRRLAELWASTGGYFSGDNAAGQRAFRRALAAQRAGNDPVEAAFRDPQGRGRRDGQDDSEAIAKARARRERGESGADARRQRTRGGQPRDRTAELTRRLTRLEQARAELEARRSAGETGLDDLIDFHGEEVERLRKRTGSTTTPDDAVGDWNNRSERARNERIAEDRARAAEVDDQQPDAAELADLLGSLQGAVRAAQRR